LMRASNDAKGEEWEREGRALDQRLRPVERKTD